MQDTQSPTPPPHAGTAVALIGEFNWSAALSHELRCSADRERPFFHPGLRGSEGSHCIRPRRSGLEHPVSDQGKKKRHSEPQAQACVLRIARCVVMYLESPVVVWPQKKKVCAFLVDEGGGGTMRAFANVVFCTAVFSHCS